MAVKDEAERDPQTTGLKNEIKETRDLEDNRSFESPSRRSMLELTETQKTWLECSTNPDDTVSKFNAQLKLKEATQRARVSARFFEPVQTPLWRLVFIMGPVSASAGRVLLNEMSTKVRRPVYRFFLGCHLSLIYRTPYYVPRLEDLDHLIAHLNKAKLERLNQLFIGTPPI